MNNEFKLSDIIFVEQVNDKITNKTNLSKLENQHNIIQASELIKMNLPEVRWIINDILPAGLTILAARPKSGKSFLALDLGMSVVSGTDFLDKFSTNQTNALYISNEDSINRMQNRLKRIIKAKNIIETENLSELHINTDFPKLTDYGLNQLTKIIKQKKLGLIIIDTFFKQVDFGAGKQNSYIKEYETTGKLQSFAIENNIALIVITHTRKAPSDDVFDSVLGTTGLTGSADTIWVIDKKQNTSILEIIGKDVEPASIVMKFENFLWTFKENFIDLRLTPEREEILNLLEDAGKPLRTSEIAEKINKKTNNVSSLLKKMLAEEVITNPDYGFYEIKKNKTD